ncbi:hypothetical protein NDU88_001054 [Pleurodeles waltl]|uniref:Uncharacterized protein n=1 Tax=Pleurodeles waltl TaxID=8319 RepID=A0AAV7U6G3_PLEWA|nr:hypothetical protein NDU88_001054 [Pleurodeles waltl]
MFCGSASDCQLVRARGEAQHFTFRHRPHYNICTWPKIGICTSNHKRLCPVERALCPTLLHGPCVRGLLTPLEACCQPHLHSQGTVHWDVDPMSEAASTVHGSAPPSCMSSEAARLTDQRLQSLKEVL